MTKHRRLVSYGMMRILLGAKLIIIEQDALTITLESQFKSLGHINKIGKICSLTVKEMIYM
jgi:hypothetical protein